MMNIMLENPIALLSLPCVIAGAAWVMERLFGYPDGLFRLIRHPVVWFGASLSFLETRLNRAEKSDRHRRVMGVAALAAITLLWCGLAILLQNFCLNWHNDGDGRVHAILSVIAFLWLCFCCSTLLASRSLYQHVVAVADALDAEDLPAARLAVAKIVGRRTQDLDESGVTGAAMESLAENFSDGVIAPFFWLSLFGLPGGVLYKVVNTADSMIGHKNARYRAFGWAAARLDDLLNLPGSRLSALAIGFAAVLLRDGSCVGAFAAVRRDAGHHVSPNAGWPEAALAGALDVRLGGPRLYEGHRVDASFMGNGSVPSRADLRRALNLYRFADLIGCGLVFSLVSSGLILFRYWPS